MTSVVLDSSPTVPIRIPSEVSFNVSPSYLGKKRRYGQPLLGAPSQFKHTHFVPMGDALPQVKKLLEIAESDNNTTLKPIQGYQEILKAEKDNDDTAKETEKVIYGSNFKNEASNYLSTPKPDRVDDYSPSEKTVPVLAKNTSNLANIIAAVQPVTKIKKSKSKKMASSKQNSNKNSRKKKPPPKAKKMTSFQILTKKK